MTRSLFHVEVNRIFHILPFDIFDQVNSYDILIFQVKRIMQTNATFRYLT